MDIIKLYEDFHVDYRTEGHKHCRPGWVNTECPFCTGNPGYHLGFPADGKVFVCWRCGEHNIPDTISMLLNVDKKEAFRIMRQYKGLTSIKKVQPVLNKKSLKLPTHTGPLKDSHRVYLEKRGFDPDYLVNHWGVQSTGPLSKLDKIWYKHRIFIPIYWNGELVSFQTRDVTGKSDTKYKACPQDREKIMHKHILYSHPKKWENLKDGTGIGVEGVTDVWKLGDSAVATFGIKYKKQQMKIIAKHFKRFAVVFDDDPQAIIQAEKLVAYLQVKNVDAWRVNIQGDPGSMSDDDARHLVNEITKKSFIV